MTPTTSSPEPISQSLLERLLDAVQMPVRIAQHGLGLAQWLLLGHLLCAAWFGFLFWNHFHPPLWLLAIASLLLSLPTLISGQLYLVLQEICGLQEQVGTLLASAKTTATQSQQFLASNSTPKDPNPQKGFKITDLFSLGGKLLEIKSLADQLMGLTALSGSMMLLANPLFLIATGIAIAALPIAILVAGISLALIVMF